MQLNERETALLIWIVVLAAALFLAPKTRPAALSLVEAALNKKIVGVVFAFSIYVAAEIWLLAVIGLWDAEQTTNTAFWFVSVGIASTFRAATARARPQLFREWILENLKLLAFVEFVVGLYSFSLIFELILLPVVFFVSVIAVMAEGQPKTRAVARLFNGTLALVGLGVLAYSIVGVATHFSEFASIETIRSLSTPGLLSLFSIPFLFGIFLYGYYESQVPQLRFAISDGKLRRYAMMRALLAFKADTELYRRWSASVAVLRPSDATGVDESIQTIKRAKDREDNPPVVATDAGWSPYQSKAFLDQCGLTTGHYRRSFDEWTAASPYLEIGSALLPDNLAYYVYGDELVARSLCLVLNVNNPDTASHSEAKLAEAATILFSKAVGGDFPNPLGSPSWLNEGECEIAPCVIRVTRDNWTGGIRGGYDKRFQITMRPPT